MGGGDILQELSIKHFRNTHVINLKSTINIARSGPPTLDTTTIHEVKVSGGWGGVGQHGSWPQKKGKQKSIFFLPFFLCLFYKKILFFFWLDFILINSEQKYDKNQYSQLNGLRLYKNSNNKRRPKYFWPILSKKKSRNKKTKKWPDGPKSALPQRQSQRLKWKMESNTHFQRF